MGLAERVMEWTREWKEEGRQEEREKGLENLRDVVLSLLEQRFGPAFSTDARRRVLAIQNLDELNKIAKGVLRTQSLRELGIE